VNIYKTLKVDFIILVLISNSYVYVYLFVIIIIICIGDATDNEDNIRVKLIWLTFISALLFFVFFSSHQTSYRCFHPLSVLLYTFIFEFIRLCSAVILRPSVICLHDALKETTLFVTVNNNAKGE
jgi:hypothetical protein